MTSDNEYYVNFMGKNILDSYSIAKSPFRRNEVKRYESAPKSGNAIRRASISRLTRLWYSTGQLEKLEHGPPAPAGTDGGKFGIEVRIGQFGFRQMVLDVQINLPAEHDISIRRRAVRVKRRDADRIRLTRQE